MWHFVVLVLPQGLLHEEGGMLGVPDLVNLLLWNVLLDKVRQGISWVRAK